jgi:hypothetical protein
MFGDDTQLAAFGRDLRDAAAAAAPPVLGEELHAVLVEGLPDLADGSSLTPTPAPRRARPAWVRAAVAGAVASFTFGGLGVAGALPDAVQGPLAGVADAVGIPGVPDPDDDAPPVTDAPPPTAPPVERPEPAAERPGAPTDTPPAAEPADVPPHAGPGGTEPPGLSEELEQGRSADHADPPAAEEAPASGPDGTRGADRAEEMQERRDARRSQFAAGDDTVA